MANRNFNKKQALEKEVKDLYAKVSIGGTGACTLVKTPGIASISRTSQGLYRLVLEDSYYALKFFSGVVLSSTAEDIIFQVKAEAVNAAVPYIDFYTLASASVVNPNSGDVLLLKIEVKNSSAV